MPKSLRDTLHGLFYMISSMFVYAARFLDGNKKYGSH